MAVLAKDQEHLVSEKMAKRAEQNIKRMGGLKPLAGVTYSLNPKGEVNLSPKVKQALQAYAVSKKAVPQEAMRFVQPKKSKATEKTATKPKVKKQMEAEGPKLSEKALAFRERIRSQINHKPTRVQMHPEVEVAATRQQRKAWEKDNFNRSAGEAELSYLSQREVLRAEARDRSNEETFEVQVTRHLGNFKPYRTLVVRNESLEHYLDVNTPMPGYRQLVSDTGDYKAVQVVSRQQVTIGNLTIPMGFKMEEVFVPFTFGEESSRQSIRVENASYHSRGGAAVNTGMYPIVEDTTATDDATYEEALPPWNPTTGVVERYEDEDPFEVPLCSYALRHNQKVIAAKRKQRYAEILTATLDRRRDELFAGYTTDDMKTMHMDLVRTSRIQHGAFLYTPDREETKPVQKRADAALPTGSALDEELRKCFQALNVELKGRERYGDLPHFKYETLRNLQLKYQMDPTQYLVSRKVRKHKGKLEYLRRKMKEQSLTHKHRLMCKHHTVNPKLKHVLARNMHKQQNHRAAERWQYNWEHRPNKAYDSWFLNRVPSKANDPRADTERLLERLRIMEINEPSVERYDDDSFMYQYYLSSHDYRNFWVRETGDEPLPYIGTIRADKQLAIPDAVKPVTLDATPLPVVAGEKAVTPDLIEGDNILPFADHQGKDEEPVKIDGPVPEHPLNFLLTQWWHGSSPSMTNGVMHA